ncbi:sensor domain-containing protein [Tsuneonella sp. HG222]
MASARSVGQMTTLMSDGDRLRRRETQLSNIFSQSLVGIMECGPDGKVKKVNDRFCDILGRSEEELQSFAMNELVHPCDYAQTLPIILESVADGVHLKAEIRYIRPDGSPRWCDVDLSRVSDSFGMLEGVMIIAKDIADRKNIDLELKEASIIHQNVLEAIVHCIKVINIEGRIVSMNNPGLCAMEIDGFDAIRNAVWVDLWPVESRQLAQAAIIDGAAGRVARFSGFCPTAKGQPKWWDVVVSPILNEEGEVTKLLSISRDITVQRSAAAEVKWASEHDPLTGLANRRAFEARLQASIIRAMQAGGKVGLLLLDLDHFKHVNDTLGHAAGDHLLFEFGKRLRECVRGGDFVARLGGDEFAVIVEEADIELDLPAAGRSILQRLGEPIPFAGRVLSAGASIGAALFPDDAKTANELFNNADIALYALKENGRGGTRMFHQHMREQAQLVSSQLSLARNAVTATSVEPHYQQKIELSTGRIAGFEALLRWRHATRGIQEPATVAEAFKDFELASRIGDLVQQRVFRDMRLWLDKDVPFGFVAINAAPVEFLRDDFAERLLDRMQEHGIPPHLVEIEVTEHAFNERSSDYVGRALQKLSHRGLRIALDDFGTGSSSLAHLRDYPVDVVKIDRSFIEKVIFDPEVRAIVCAIINLAKSLKIEVVAEGVETQDQRRYLLKQGCEMGQGYLFGRAVQAADLPSLLSCINPNRFAA